jgi:AraC family transcriptional regulator
LLAAMLPRQPRMCLMTLKIEERPALTVVGMEIVTQPKSAEIPGLWPKFVARIGDIQNPREALVSYGVMWHGESMHVMHYMAAVSVAKPGRVPGGMTLMILPAGKYASFRYPLSGLAEGFCEISNRLLPSSGYGQAPGPFFERYDEAFDPRNPGSLVEICLPIRSLRPVTLVPGHGVHDEPGVDRGRGSGGRGG